jgi:hypothetical protein
LGLVGVLFGVLGRAGADLFKSFVVLNALSLLQRFKLSSCGSFKPMVVDELSFPVLDGDPCLRLHRPGPDRACEGWSLGIREIKVIQLNKNS